MSQRPNFMGMKSIVLLMLGGLLGGGIWYHLRTSGETPSSTPADIWPTQVPRPSQDDAQNAAGCLIVVVQHQADTALLQKAHAALPSKVVFAIPPHSVLPAHAASRYWIQGLYGEPEGYPKVHDAPQHAIMTFLSQNTNIQRIQRTLRPVEQKVQGIMIFPGHAVLRHIPTMTYIFQWASTQGLCVFDLGHVLTPNLHSLATRHWAAYLKSEYTCYSLKDFTHLESSVLPKDRIIVTVPLTQPSLSALKQWLSRTALPLRSLPATLKESMA